ncbi:MAG: hypothetical protein ACHP7H_03270 [Hyphomicrobiales bacterium]
MELLIHIRGVANGVYYAVGACPRHVYVGARNAAALKKLLPTVSQGVMGRYYVFGMQIHPRLDFDNDTVLCTIEPLADPLPANSPIVEWIPVR